MSHNPADWTINTGGNTFPTTTPNITGQVFYGTNGAGSKGVTVWYNNLVYIDGFTATFTYQDVGGGPGNNADGAAFVLQSGPTFISGAGGSLSISGLTPSADWEFNLYQPNGIGAIYHTDGTTGGYFGTAPSTSPVAIPSRSRSGHTPGGAVAETLYDTLSQATYTTNFNIGDITALLGSSYAYMGFSCADGGWLPSRPSVASYSSAPSRL